MIAPPAAAPTYQLKFHDDFNVLDLNATRDPRKVSTWVEGIYYNECNPQADISVTNSVLSLKWHREACGQTDVSAMLVFRYGYFEARLRFNPVLGMWPAFWMEPVEAINGATHTGEIDIMEFMGDDLAHIFTTWHEWQGSTDLANNADSNAVVLPADFDSRAWHKYGMLWTPGQAVWYLDDAQVNASALPPIFDEQHFFPIVSMLEGINWIPGDLVGANGEQVANSLELQADYVRVWQAQ